MEPRTSILDGIEIASPCHAGWEDMAGDERSRFCGQCRLNVYNLSAMTRGEAEALVAEKEGRLCVRFYRRRDGTVLTQNCPVGWQRERKRLWPLTGGFSAAIAFVCGLFRVEPPAVVMGGPRFPLPGVIPADPRRHDGQVETVAMMGVPALPVVGDARAPRVYRKHGAVPVRKGPRRGGTRPAR